MITPKDITGVDDDLAREVLVLARSIAPGIDALEGEPRKDAIAIIRRVARDSPTAGSRRTRSMSRNGTSMSFSSGATFDDDAVRALLALCTTATESRPGLPRGSFPKQSPLTNVWPEGEYS
ncbi:hypothetical protein [Microbacterium sp.]|uniref:hypothetical protein n=1 Tax=Microbacterium sp. TaxID=51671 RepID=UPI003F70FC15